ncbi:MAG TPA: PIN domain-containing protein [Chloroflexota bacterium]|nr:PIN domain-containing protein [Chloroflexota bacterium]
MIVVDTSVIVAFMKASDAAHANVSAWIDAERQELGTTPLIVSEADHLVFKLGGRNAAAALRADLAIGAYVLEWWPEAIGAAMRIADRYANLRVSLADASLVALADRVATIEIATLDERHFRVLRPLSGGDAFRLLPRDA